MKGQYFTSYLRDDFYTCEAHAWRGDFEENQFWQELEEIIARVAQIPPLQVKGLVLRGDLRGDQTCRNYGQLSELRERGQSVLRQIEDLQLPKFVLLEGPCASLWSEVIWAFEEIWAVHHRDAWVQFSQFREITFFAYGTTYRLIARIGAHKCAEVVTLAPQLTIAQAHRIGLIDEMVDPYGPREFLSQMRQRLAKNLREKKSRGVRSIVELIFQDLVFIRKFYWQILKDKAYKQGQLGHQQAWRWIDFFQEVQFDQRDQIVAKERIFFQELATSPIKQAALYLHQCQHDFQRTQRQLVLPVTHQTAPPPLFERGKVLLQGGGPLAPILAFGPTRRGLAVNFVDASETACNHLVQQLSKLYYRWILEQHLSMDLWHSRQRLLTIRKELPARQIQATPLLTLQLSEPMVELISVRKGRAQAFLSPHLTPLPTVIEIRFEALTPESTLGQCEQRDLALYQSYFEWIGFTPFIHQGPSFITPSLLARFYNGVAFTAQYVGSLKRVLTALREWGVMIDPFAQMDQIGIDRLVEWTKAPQTPAPLLLQMMQKMAYGVRVGRGFYRYGSDGEELDAELFDEAGGEPLTQEQIIHQIFYPLISDCYQLIADGAGGLQPAAVDFLLCALQIFPSSQGGPFYYAEKIGCEKIALRLKELHFALNELRFQPALALTHRE